LAEAHGVAVEDWINEFNAYLDARPPHD
jgi:hypothetical protein